jgi:hypothetical protein
MARKKTGISRRQRLETIKISGNLQKEEARGRDNEWNHLKEDAGIV